MFKRIFLLLPVFLSSCAFLPRAAKTPVPVVERGSEDSGELVVLMPGRWSTLNEFEREGFFEITEKRWPDARVVAADLHLEYYKNQSMATRLHKDVILPAKRAGVTTVRLVGISMGGLGALIYDLEHPGVVDEMVLLSPFLGEEEVLAEIRMAGGLEKWEPGEIEEADFSRKLWVGLKRNWKNPANRPGVFLGCGKEDRLAGASRLFAGEFLEADDQKWTPGGHDWETWRELFGQSRKVSVPEGHQ